MSVFQEMLCLQQDISIRVKLDVEVKKKEKGKKKKENKLDKMKAAAYSLFFPDSMMLLEY